jgi:hypothetical protein
LKPRKKEKNKFGKIDSVKTQIIQLEAHDDTISVKDKIDWSQTPRVLLIWPERGKVLSNRLDLIILERYCTSHGCQLALLTKDYDVQFQAREAGIPIFLSRKQAQLQSWRTPQTENRQINLKDIAGEPRGMFSAERIERPSRLRIPIWGRIIIFSIGVLAVLAIAGLLLPSAVIKIDDEGDPQQLTIPIKADPDATEVHLTGIIPAREKTLIISGQKSSSTTGSISIPDEYSSGEVIFTNLTESSIQIPQGSILSTSSEVPILFETTQPGKTPQGSGGQVSVSIKALDAGSSGNVEAGQISSINQEFGADLLVTNPEPTSGGTDLEIASPSITDKTILSSQLTSELQEQALRQFKEESSETDVLFESSLFINEIITEEIKPEIGSAGDTLRISTTIQFGILYAAGDDLSKLAKETVQAQYRGSDLKAVPESLKFKTPESPQKMEDWAITIQWNEIIRYNPQEIIQLVGGKRPTEAAEIVQEALGLDQLPEISLRPGWWVRLPMLPFRISFLQVGG